MTIYGKWHEKSSAAQLNASFAVINESFCVEIETGIIYRGKLSSLIVSDRLANIQRKIILENGSVFVTSDNDNIDEIFKKQLKYKKMIHTLETKTIWIFLAIVVSIVFGISFFKWGVPYFSKEIAHSLPAKTNILISANTLEILDKYIFKETKISQKTILEIREHFNSNIASLDKLDGGLKYKLHFRLFKNGDLSLPNAMALPSGDIILTDKFIELCKTQEEMDSVLLHEMGHIIHRDSLTMVIEGAFISLAIMAIVGDVNFLADMGVGIGSLLISSSYTREHESKADIYAFNKMLSAKMDPIAFTNIMNRMSKYMNKSLSKDDEKDFSEYISTHPKTDKRVKIAKRYSECFKKGLSSCVQE